MFLICSGLQSSTYKSYITFVIHPPLMMAQSWAESTWEITNYGRFINQFQRNIIRSIRKFERINKKICRQKNVCLFNQTFINIDTCLIEHNRHYIYIYIYCHPQTDCFVISQLFSVSKHVGHLKTGIETRST